MPAKKAAPKRITSVKVHDLVAPLTLRSPPLPTPPAFPARWTPATIAGYVASLVTFAIGVLTSLGVVVPAGVSSDAEVIAGAVVVVVSAIGALATTLSQHSLTRAALEAGS